MIEETRGRIDYDECGTGLDHCARARIVQHRRGVATGHCHLAMASFAA